MLFIIPDFLKASSPAVATKYFNPPPRHVGQKKFPWRHPSVSTPLVVDNDQSKLAYYSPHCMIKHALKGLNANTLELLNHKFNKGVLARVKS